MQFKLKYNLQKTNLLFSILILLITIFMTSCDNDTGIYNQHYDNCQKKYNLYKNTKKYKVRIENEIQKHGCEVIPIYSAIIKSEKFDILNQIEENPQLIIELKKLFHINSNLKTLLFDNPTLNNIIINNSLNHSFLQNFIYLTDKKLYKKDIKKIKYNNHYLNYFL